MEVSTLVMELVKQKTRGVGGREVPTVCAPSPTVPLPGTAQDISMGFCCPQHPLIPAPAGLTHRMSEGDLTFLFNSVR